MKFKTFVLSLLSTILFGVIDSVLFLVCERTIQKEMMKIQGVDETMAELTISGISAAVAIFVTFYVYDLIRKYHKIKDHPAFDAVGVLVGTGIILLVYVVWKSYRSNAFN